MLAIEHARGGTIGDLIKSSSESKRTDKLSSAEKKLKGSQSKLVQKLSEEDCAKAIKGIL